MTTIHIQQLSPEHWQAYRVIRLAAVKSDPAAFGNTYEEELEFSEERWRTFITNMYFAMVDQQIVGMIGLLMNNGLRNKHRATMVSFWVYPEYRGLGIGALLISHVQNIARQKGIIKIDLNVMVTQANAIELYQRQGFTRVGISHAFSYVHDNFLDAVIMEWFVSSR